MEQIQYGSGIYTTAASLPTFYVASDEFDGDFNFIYTTTVIGKNVQLDNITVEYSTLQPYGYVTLNEYNYDSTTGYLTVDFTITVNRMTAGALVGSKSVFGTLIVKAYFQDDLIKTLTSTISPSFYIYDKSKRMAVENAAITVPNLTPAYNDYSISQVITLTNIVAGSLWYNLDYKGNVDNVSSSLTTSSGTTTLAAKWTEYYFPIKYENEEMTSSTTPELNSQFVFYIKGISSTTGRWISATCIVDKTYNDILDNISIQTKYTIGWQDPSYTIVIGRSNDYSATISSCQFIDGKEHSWYQDKQIFNTDKLQYSVNIYSQETTLADSGYYRIYFNNGKKVDILLTKNGYPEAYTPSLGSNFTLPLNIEEEVDYQIMRSTDIRSFKDTIVSGHLYAYKNQARLQLGDIIKYYSGNIEITNDPINVTADTKHNFSWATKNIFKGYIFDVKVDSQEYYVAPEYNYRDNSSSASSIYLASFYKKIYKDIPFYISINIDYATKLVSTVNLTVYEWNSTTNKWDTIWSKENYDAYNGVVHQWYKYYGSSAKLKVELKVGNSLQYSVFSVEDKQCLSNSYGYLYYVNDFGGVDLIGINATSQETSAITNTECQIENYNDYKTDYVTTQYNKKIVRGWTCKTDLVDDEESKNYLDLFHSNTLKLYINDKWYDVNISDTKYTVKTVKNNSLKKFNISFTLTENIEYNKVK